MKNTEKEITFSLKRGCWAIGSISLDIELVMNVLSLGQWSTDREVNMGKSIASPTQNFSSFGSPHNQRDLSLGKEIFSNLPSACSSVISTSSMELHSLTSRLSSRTKLLAIAKEKRYFRPLHWNTHRRVKFWKWSVGSWSEHKSLNFMSDSSNFSKHGTATWNYEL